MPGPWGKAIEGLRLSKKLARGTVAKRARMTPTTYGRIERGQHTQTRKLQYIADAFGVSIDHVLLPHGRGVTGADPAAAVTVLQSQIDALERKLAALDARVADDSLEQAFDRAMARQQTQDEGNTERRKTTNVSQRRRPK